ncbi:hypothetical protein C8R43DRAFT_1027553 [Mycena crocata]|nr:hypothetical protein C8R43DRAFT_1027553 [Mycena crocata]
MLPNALCRTAIRHGTGASTHASRSCFVLSTPFRTLSTIPVASPEAKKVLQQHLNPPSCNLLIKNLPPGVTESEVHATLASYGPVDSWRPFFNATKGKHAFITFTEQEAADAVHDAREHMSVALSVGYFNSKSETETAPDPTELFVGKLPPSATETAVRAAFSPFGEIESWRPLHRSRHRIWCGFLKFVERRAAEEALAAAEVCIPVTYSVEYALPRHKDAKGLHPCDGRDAATTSA